MANTLGLLQMLEIVEQDFLCENFQKYRICSNSGGFFGGFFLFVCFVSIFFLWSLAGWLKRVHI